MATGYAPRLGDSAEYLAAGRRPPAGQPLHRPHGRPRRVRGRRRRHRRARRSSTRWPAASASALAVDAWLRGEDLERARGAARRLQRRCRTSSSSADEAQLGELGAAPRRARPRVAQDGRERRAGASRHHAQGRQAEAAHGHRPRGREGLQPRRRPRRGQALPAVRVPEHRRLRPAEARRRVRHHRQRPRREGQPGPRRSSPSTSTRSSAAT